jgi:hypothetical protein
MKRASPVLAFAFGLAAALSGCQQPMAKVTASPAQPTTRPMTAADYADRSTPFVDAGQMFKLEDDVYIDASAWVSGPLTAPQAPTDVRVLSFTARLMQARTLHEQGEVYAYADRKGAEAYETRCGPANLGGDGLQLSAPGAGLGKTSGAWIVRLQPRAGLTWGDVSTPDDFRFTIEKAD